MKKRIVSLVLAFVLVISAFVVPVSAAGASQIKWNGDDEMIIPLGQTGTLRFTVQGFAEAPLFTVKICDLDADPNGEPGDPGVYCVIEDEVPTLNTVHTANIDFDPEVFGMPAGDYQIVYAMGTDLGGEFTIYGTWKSVPMVVVEKPGITKQPAESSAKLGEKVYTSVEAAGEGLTYQWYVKSAKGTAYSKSSVTKPTYSAVMSTSSRDRYVYCVVTDAYGRTVETDPVQLRLAATVTEQPADAVAALGEKATVSFTALGDDLTYTWYYKDANSSKFLKTSSFTGPSYYVTMTAARAGREVYCVVTDKYGNEDVTDTVTLKTPASGITVTKQPEEAFAKLGEKVKTAVTAEGEGLTYQWYVKSAKGSTYSKSSVTKATYSAVMSTSSRDRSVYCVISDAYGNTVTTDPVQLHLAATVTEQPENAVAALGEKATVSFTALGDDLTYAWYYKDANSAKFLKTSSFTGPSYYVTMTAARADREVYCVVTDKYGNEDVTDTVTLKTPAAVTVTKQPESVTVAEGETAAVTFTAQGTGLSYAWYYRNAGAAGFTYTATFTGPRYSVVMNASRAGREVYCVVTDANGNTVQTNTVTLSME